MEITRDLRQWLVGVVRVGVVVACILVAHPTSAVPDQYHDYGFGQQYGQQYGHGQEHVQYYQQASDVGVSSQVQLQAQPQNRIHSLGIANAFQFNGDISSPSDIVATSLPSNYTRLRTHNFKIIGNLATEDHSQPQQQELRYPGIQTVPNVRVVSKGQPQQAFHPTQPQPQPTLPSPSLSAGPHPNFLNHQNPSVTRVTYLSSVATLNLGLGQGQRRANNGPLAQNHPQPTTNFLGQVFQTQKQFEEGRLRHAEEAQAHARAHGHTTIQPGSTFRPSLPRPTPTIPTLTSTSPAVSQPVRNTGSIRPSPTDPSLPVTTQRQPARPLTTEQYHRAVISPRPTGPTPYSGPSPSPQHQSHRFQFRPSSPPPVRFPNNFQQQGQPAGPTQFPPPSGFPLGRSVSGSPTPSTYQQRQTIESSPQRQNQGLDAVRGLRRLVLNPNGRLSYYDGTKYVDFSTSSSLPQYVESNQYQHAPIQGPVEIAVLPPSQHIQQFISQPVNSNSLDGSDLQYSQPEQPLPSFTHSIATPAPPVQSFLDNNQLSPQQTDNYQPQPFQTDPALSQYASQFQNQQSLPQPQLNANNPTGQGGFQPNNFLQQPQQPQFQGQSHPPGHGPPGQGPPPGPHRQFPPGFPFDPKNPGKLLPGFLPLPPGEVPGPGQPPFILENGFNPEPLAPFPEGPYESEFLGLPRLNPRDAAELEEYSAKRQNPQQSRRRNSPGLGGQEDSGTTPSTSQVLRAVETRPIPQKCAYNTLGQNPEGEDCVEIRKKRKSSAA